MVKFRKNNELIKLNVKSSDECVSLLFFSLIKFCRRMFLYYLRIQLNKSELANR